MERMAQQMLPETHVSYNPGGTIVHGDLPKDLALQIATLGVQVKGAKLWYTCNSCKRTIRFEDKEEHNEKFHYQVECEECSDLVDQFHLDHHTREECLARVTFCKHCSAQITFGELDTHEENCFEAKLAMKEGIEPISYPSYMPDKIPEVKGIIELGQKFALASHADKYFEEPRKIAAKHERYGKIFPLKTSGSLPFVSLKNDYNPEEDHEALLSFCTAKILSKPEEMWKMKILDQKLKEDADKVIDDLLQNPVHPVNKSKDERRKPTSAYTTVQQMMKEREKQGNYLRNIHKLNSQISRQEARRYTESKKRNEMLAQFESYHRKLRDLKAGDEKQFVIDQATKLIENQDKVELVPNDEWKDFIQNVKNTRKVWQDFAIGSQDADLGEGDRSKSKEYHEKLALLKNKPRYKSIDYGAGDFGAQ